MTTETLHSTLRERGQLTLPPAVREALDVKTGDEIMFEIVDGTVVVHAATWVPRSQAWFWTPEWQEGERQAAEQIATGQTTVVKSADDMFGQLDR
jgi:antitoxin PrlF